MTDGMIKGRKSTINMLESVESLRINDEYLLRATLREFPVKLSFPRKLCPNLNPNFLFVSAFAYKNTKLLKVQQTPVIFKEALLLIKEKCSSTAAELEK